MNDANRVYESEEGEGEFYGFGGGRLGGLGEGVAVDIINNERNAENEDAGNEVHDGGLVSAQGICRRTGTARAQQ